MEEPKADREDLEWKATLCTHLRLSGDDATEEQHLLLYKGCNSKEPEASISIQHVMMYIEHLKQHQLVQHPF